MAASGAQHGGSRARPRRAALAGVIAGAAIVSGLAVADLPSSGRRRTPPAETAPAAEGFLRAWERSRTSTWAVESIFTRSGTGGPRLEAVVHRAQRPPDRLLRGLGSVDARRGDTELVCGSKADDPERLVCREGRALDSYDAEVAEELDRLRQYVLGGDALYAVRQEDGGCWFLRLRFELPSPPYGRAARFCFDGRTGAPVFSEVQRDEGTDVMRAVNVDASPTDEDLAPPPVP